MTIIVDVKNELLDRLEAAEKERANANAAAVNIALEAERLQCENDNLRAKIEATEKQEPVAFGLYGGWALKATYLKEHEACEQRDRRQLTADLSGSLEAYRVVPLYALPGAQTAPSVPMDVIADYLVSISAHLARRDDAKAQAEIGELLKMIASAPKPGASVPEDVMRDAERYRYLRARDDGTAGVGCWIEADGRVCDRGWLYGVQLDSAIDSFIEVLAAAPKPEAKP